MCNICYEPIDDKITFHECAATSLKCVSCFLTVIMSDERIRQFLSYDGLPCKFCNKYISIDDLLAHANDQKTKEMLATKTTDIFLHDHALHRKCANLECQTSYLLDLNCDTEWTCPSCHSHCIICKTSEHNLSNCPSKQNTKADLYSRFRIEYDKWTNKAKTCPNCNILIYKTGGCNHMFCQSCFTHFCWNCCVSNTSGHNCPPTWQTRTKLYLATHGVDIIFGAYCATVVWLIMK